MHERPQVPSFARRPLLLAPRVAAFTFAIPWSLPDSTPGELGRSAGLLSIRSSVLPLG